MLPPSCAIASLIMSLITLLTDRHAFGAPLSDLSRAMFFPILVVCGLWVLYLHPALVLKHTPVVSGFNTTSISQSPPICPSTPLQAFTRCVGQSISKYCRCHHAATHPCESRVAVDSAGLLGLHHSSSCLQLCSMSFRYSARLCYPISAVLMG